MPGNPRELSRSRKAPPENRSTPAPVAQSPSGARGARAGNASSFAARFGRVILQHGVAAIPSALFHFQGRLGLTAQQVWFVSYILAHKWAEALPHPSLNKMAQCTGVDRRVLQYRCAELTNLGLLQIQPRYGERGDQDANYFDFSGLFEQLETILLDEPVVPNPIRDAEGRQSFTDLASLEARDLYIRGVRGAGGDRETATGASGQDVELDYSFLARYGRVLLRYGIATVPKAIFTHQVVLDLTPQQVWFVCYILSFQWDTSLPYPSINKMAERTGYSKRQLLRIKDELVAARYLEVVRRTSTDRGNDTNAYDFSPLFESIRRQLRAPKENQDKAAPDQVAAHNGIDEDTEDTEDSVDQQITDEAAEEETPQPDQRRRTRPAQPRSRSAGSSMRPVESSTKSNIPVEPRVTRGVEQGVTRGTERGDTSPVEHSVTRGIAQDVTGPVAPTAREGWQKKSPGGQKPESPEVETQKIEELHEDDSNQSSQKNGLSMTKTKAGIPGYSPYIAAVAADFSRELSDSVHEASNMKQALNLWRDSGLGEQQFVELMQEARRLTRRYQSRPTWDALNNKMAYLFTTLRDLIAQATEG